MRILFIIVSLFSVIICKAQTSQIFTLVDYEFNDERELAPVYEDSTITDENLREVYAIGIGPDGLRSEPGELSKTIAMELIDKKMFDGKRKTAVDYLKKDKAMKKANGTLILSFRGGATAIFTDNDSDNEDYSHYEYIGQITALNQYVVFQEHWEDSGFLFFNKDSGMQTASFSAEPYISPDKKNVISVSANPYDGVAEFSLYKINPKGIEIVISATFKNWMPYSDLAFYSNDGWLYMPVNHITNYWAKTGQFNTIHQYIRVKVL